MALTVKEPMDIKYRQMRDELVEHLHDLTDPQKVAAGGPSGSLLDYAVHFLFDDTSLADDPSSLIGWILANEQEAEAVRALCGALNTVFERYGTERSDAEYIEVPEWVQVVKAARQAYALLQRGNHNQ